MITREEKRKAACRGLARASMILRRDLWWTSGFPLIGPIAAAGKLPELKPSTHDAQQVLPWQRVPWRSPGKFVTSQLDRESLRASELALSRLRHQHRHSLTRLLTHPAPWLDHVAQMISALKRVLHGEEDPKQLFRLPENRKTSVREQDRWIALRETFPAISECVRWVQLLVFMNPDPRAGTTLRWMESAARSLGEIRSPATHRNPFRDRSLLQIRLVCCRQSIGKCNQINSIVGLLNEKGIQRLPWKSPLGEITNRATRLKKAIDHQSVESLEPIPAGPDSGANINETILERIVCGIDRGLGGKPDALRSYLRVLAALGESDIPATLTRLHLEVGRLTSRLHRIENRLRSERACQLRWRSRAMRDDRKFVSDPFTLDCDAASDMGRVLNIDPAAHPEFAKATTRWIVATNHQPRLALAMVRSLLDRKTGVTYDAPATDAARAGRMMRRRSELLLELARAMAEKTIPPPLVSLLCRSACVESDAMRLQLFAPWVSHKDLKKPDSGNTAVSRSLRSLIELLSELYQDARSRETTCPDDSVVQSSSQILNEMKDVSLATTLAIRLRQRQLPSRLYTNEISTLLPFADDVDELAEMLMGLKQSKYNCSSIRSLKPLADQPETRKLVRHWIENGANRKLDALARYADAVTGFGGSNTTAWEQPINSIRDATWLKRYPIELWKDLERLCAVTPQAQEVAGRLLGKDFADPTKGLGEFNYLEHRLAANDLPNDLRDRFQLRRASVLRQLLNPTPVQPGRLQNLKHRLQQRLLFEVEKQVRANWNRQLTRSLQRYGIDGADSLMADPTTSLIVTGLAEVDPPMRRLGIRLLELHFQGGEFSDFEHPANDRFISQLRSQGIRPEPWLDNSRTLAVHEDQSGAAKKPQAAFRLRFAKTPLEYLLMGHHFSTCLAPDDFNFFSTISNAVDVNKRVLYGRDEKGRVIGRCLIALTDQGQLITFRCYSHEQGDRFRDAVHRFCHDLATAMGTGCGTTGKVSKLVAPSWYDDGAVPVLGAQREEANRDFRELIGSLFGIASPGEHALGQIEEQTLRALRFDSSDKLIELLPQRNETLCGDVIRIVGRLTDAGDERCRLRFAIWAARVGDKSWLDDALRPFSRKRLIEFFRRSRCGDSRCNCFHRLGSDREIHEVLRRVPADDALAILRATRDRRVRSDLQETNPVRRQWLAECHSRLGRKNLPRRLQMRRGQDHS